MEAAVSNVMEFLQRKNSKLEKRHGCRFSSIPLLILIIMRPPVLPPWMAVVNFVWSFFAEKTPKLKIGMEADF
jgi:hypothetical protein